MWQRKLDSINLNTHASEHNRGNFQNIAHDPSYFIQEHEDLLSKPRKPTKRFLEICQRSL